MNATQQRKPFWSPLRWPRLRSVPAPLPFASQDLVLEPGASVVVLAPHCDDETLGAGGLIHFAVEAGCAVHVVLLTNGDGFNRYAMGGRYRRLRLSPAQYIEFAQIRQQETLQALGLLGLPPDAVTFLGYPDRGLAAMWDEYWDDQRLYRSRFTGVERSPYENSLTPEAPFCGRSVAADVKSLLIRTQPTHLITPHPHDAHGDHWATYCFALYALEELKAEGREFAHTTHVLGYLVHRGLWPRPPGLRPRLPLHPPRSFAHLPLPWVTLELPPDTVRVKRDALRQHRSQLTYMGPYLFSFVRRNELFGVFKPLQVPEIPAGRILVDGEVDDWEGIGAQILDPYRDSWTRHVGRSGDIRTVAVCRDQANLYLKMELSTRAVRDVVYGLTLYGVGPDPGPSMHRSAGVEHPTPGPRVRNRLRVGLRAPDRAIVEGVGRWQPGGTVVCRARNHQMEVAVPLRLLGPPERVFLGVETRYRRLLVDRIAWQALVLSSGRVDPP